MKPLITIVTVCYNSGKTIEKTIQSVLEQSSEDYEYLIIDGGSSDNTVDIIESYEDKFKGKLRWLSEKDNGWYDAMNKGIHLAQGSFINFLNSDDYYDQKVLTNVLGFIELNNISADSIVFGDSTNIYINSNGDKILRLIKAPNHISFTDNSLKDGMCGIRHQSMFIGINVFDQIGDLNVKYRLHADWDFLVKCVKANIRMYHINKNLTFYSMYGVSTKPNYEERHLLRKENGLYNFLDYYYIKDRWGIKVIMKKVLGEKNWNDLMFKLHEIRGAKK